MSVLVVGKSARKAASESSQAVGEQLSRIVAGLLVVAVAVFVIFSWDAYPTLRGVLKGVRLIEAGDGDWLTLWDVARALLWIAGGHFCVSNLAALTESAATSATRAKRYVSFTLARYVIIFIAYAVALTTLKFDLSGDKLLLESKKLGGGLKIIDISKLKLVLKHILNRELVYTNQKPLIRNTKSKDPLSDRWCLTFLSTVIIVALSVITVGATYSLPLFFNDYISK